LSRAALLALALAATGLASCGDRADRAGDSGGAATGDSLPGNAAGSARTHDSLESLRPRDTTLPSKVPDAQGRDTS
jgi:hypothetical protein